MSAIELDDFGALKNALAAMPDCRCICVTPMPEAKPASPELLAGFGVLLVGVGLGAYAAGRLRRIRQRLRDRVLT